MHLIHRKTCRLCGSPALTRVIDLGEQHLQGSFVKPGKELPPLRKIPLTLVRCDTSRDERACGLLQLEHSTPPEILYAAYWYRSGTNQTMRSHLETIARDGIALAGRPGARVLDIGCNDGTLLGYYPADYAKFGVDPSDVAQEVKAATVVQDTFPSRKLASACGGQRFDVITSIAMFYDLEDPVGCARSIADLLAPDGDVDLRGGVPADDARQRFVRHDLPRAPRVLQPRGPRVHRARCRDAGLSRRR